MKWELELELEHEEELELDELELEILRSTLNWLEAMFPLVSCIIFSRSALIWSGP